MRHFKKKISDWLSKQQNLYILFTIILMIPTCLLLYTEEMSMAMRVAYFFLPLSVYMGLLAMRQKPGIVLLWLSLLLLLGAFQEVLLYLFGNSIIASDMFLNLFTTSTGEASGVDIGLFCIFRCDLFGVSFHSYRGPFACERPEKIGYYSSL